MKIIIIILICLFFSLSIRPINEHITNPPVPQQAQPNGPQTQQAQPTGPLPAKPQPQPESGLQAQVNMLSTQITTTNAMALEAKKKVDDISSQIEQLKDALKKKPDT